MSEAEVSFLKSDLQKVIACNFNANGNMTLDFALSLVAAYSLKQLDTDTASYPALHSLIKAIRKSCFARKVDLIGQLKFDECVCHIYKRLDTVTFEDKKNLLLSLKLKLVLEIGETGHISLDENLPRFVVDKITNLPSERFVIGILASNKDGRNDIQDTESEQTGRGNNTCRYASSETDTDKSSSETIQYAKTKPSAVKNKPSPISSTPSGDSYSALFLRLKSKRDSAPQYVWQWKLSSEEYIDIKRLITGNKIPTPSKWTHEVAVVLSLYIGEFYKREYDGSNNPFRILGHQSPNYDFEKFSDLCEKLKITPYQKINNAVLYTLYVSGGIPIHQLTSKIDKGKSSIFIEGLAALIDSEDENDVTEGEEKINAVNNTALKESYCKNGSIYEYVRSMREHKSTWCNGDECNDEFKSFREKILEARKKVSSRKKFWLSYSLWTYFDNNGVKELSLTPEIRLHPEKDGCRHYAISDFRVHSWGIKGNPASFILSSGGKEISFNWCCNNDYISANLIDRIALPPEDPRKIESEWFYNKDGLLVCLTPDGEQIPLGSNTICGGVDAGYMQLFTDDEPHMASWQSHKGNRTYLWSGLIFDKSRYIPIRYEGYCDINDSLGWLWFKTNCILEDTKRNRMRTIFNSKGMIYALPAEQSIHQISNNTSVLPESITNGRIDCYINGEQSFAFLTNDLDIKFNCFRIATKESVDGDPHVQFRHISGNEWKEYVPHDRIPQGLYEFCLSLAGYSTVIYCFVLRKEASIETYSLSKPYHIKFPAISGIRCRNGNVYTHREGYPICQFKEPMSDSYTFTIPDGDSYVEFSTFAPIAQTHILMHGHEVNTVIAAFADKCQVRTISDKSSIQYMLCDKREVYKYVFNKMTATSRGEDPNLTRKRDMHEIDDNIVSGTHFICVYSRDIKQDDCANYPICFLDFKNNEVIPIPKGNPLEAAKQLAKDRKSDGLLFHSLKNTLKTDNYLAPRFISQYEGKKVGRRDKQALRIEKLTDYAKEKRFCKEDTFKQFQLANEHGLYLTFSDPLLSMIWDRKNKIFLDTGKAPFKKNLYAFFTSYHGYCNTLDICPDIKGLRRLSREFLFDWNIIRDKIESGTVLDDTYNQLTERK